jgi:cell pole-organizing protein PopZ
MAEAAAKEPSMEDILASIRKIIAQDDPRPKPTETPPARLETLNRAPQPDRPPVQSSVTAYAPPSAPASAPASASGGVSQQASPGQPSYRTQTTPRPGSASTLAALASQVRKEMPRGPSWGPSSGTATGPSLGLASGPQGTPMASAQTNSAASSGANSAAASPVTSVATGPATEPAQSASPTPQPAPVQQAAPEAAARPVQTPRTAVPSDTGGMSLAALAASVAASNPAPRVTAPYANGEPGNGQAAPVQAAPVQTGTVAAQAASVGPRPGPAPSSAPSAPASAPSNFSAFSAAPGQAPAKPSQPETPSEPPAKAAEPEKTLAQASEVNAFRDALVSPSTSRMVINSMDRLKAAVADDTSAKVEAVLRPILREWLDANLPGLVERLVREEIERIARG